MVVAIIEDTHLIYKGVSSIIKGEIMKETLFVIIGIFVGLMTGACLNNMKYTHNSTLITPKPFVINDKTYICREQIVSYKDINDPNKNSACN